LENLQGLKRNADLRPLYFILVTLLVTCKQPPQKEGKGGEILKEGEALIEIKGHRLIVELKVKESERMMGMMYRDFLPENRGMLFVYDREDYLSFWMKNTPIPLSIAFINSDKVIVDIQDMEPFTLNPHISKKPALYALEVNRGWFKKRGIGIGDTVHFIKF
jgi:hypothetical protein